MSGARGFLMAANCVAWYSCLTACCQIVSGSRPTSEGEVVAEAVQRSVRVLLPVLLWGWISTGYGW